VMGPASNNDDSKTSYVSRVSQGAFHVLSFRAWSCVTLLLWRLPPASLQALPATSTSRQRLFQHVLRPRTHRLVRIDEHVSHGVERWAGMLRPGMQRLEADGRLVGVRA